jgi:hypothetical protein
VAGAGADWIDTFVALTEGIPSPQLFRQWAAIGTVAAALERRTWTTAARRILYPNLFTLLVGPPGSGKTEAIYPARELLSEAKKFKIAPDNLTKAALVDSLTSADRKIVLPGNKLVEYHSLTIMQDEFGVLVAAHDLELLSVVSKLFDNPRTYSEQRRHHDEGKERILVHPQLNILAGSTPLFLGSLLPEEAWGQGFASRLIMIYCETVPYTELFRGGDDIGVDASRSSLIRGLQQLARLLGRWYWDTDAARELVRWHKAGMDPVPSHSRLQYYVIRRVIHMLKLCCISAASRVAMHFNGEPEMRITLPDVNRARDWMLHAESLMPDIFRGMEYRSDAAVIQALHYYAWRQWAVDRRPLHEARLIQFLNAHGVRSERVMRVIEVAERSGVLRRDAGSKLYTPRPSNEHGME